MKKIFLLFSFSAMILCLSCGKESNLKDKNGKEYNKEDGKEEDKGFCLKLVYPVIYTMPDGSTITGADEKAVWTAMKDWYEVNPESEEKPILSYPVDVILKDETTTTVDDEEAMIALKKDCEDEEDWGALELCEWNEATEASGEEFEKYTVEELVYSEDCECYVSGFEKFLENGQTRFLIYYKTEDCVGYGYKVTCENGDCKDAEKCKFFQDCE